MTEPVAGLNASISLSELSAPSAPQNLQTDIVAKLEGIRQGSHETSEFVQRGPVAVSSDVQVGPAELVGPASSTANTNAGPAADLMAPHAETLRSMSEISWRMISFEMSNAALQKTDKSIKMFIQGQ